MKIIRPRRKPEFERVSPKRRERTMGFFGELDNKVVLPSNLKPPYSPIETLAFFRGKRATIEGLKEMMVGEPIAMNLDVWDGDTLLVDKNGEIHARWDGEHHGTDGEEVYVLVVRSGGTKDDIPSADVQVHTEAEEEKGQRL